MGTYSQYAWLVPLFPLLGFIIVLAAGRLVQRIGGPINVLLSIASFVVAALIGWERLTPGIENYVWNDWTWLKIGDFNITLGFEINNLNALMLLIVTLVSMLVQLYSIGYMAEDDRKHVFFSYIALFTFSMLGVVMSENLIELYIFWELVGVCSFLLVGFWYEKLEAKKAAQKAFLVTRVGDTGLLAGILLLAWNMPGHALDFNSIFNAINAGDLSSGVITTAAILIFIGAVGKSGQFPLHTWLPDAMEGPTPISALIHAATMVAAGVYLVARSFDLFVASPTAMLTVAIIGGFTAIFAATIGLAQYDIKRILAYSTVSQLGYMMMGLGVSTTFAAGMFHLYTHAFFKALLFLGAGSVIHAVHTQDIREMGGLSKHMKITTWTFAIGTLALSGVPPFAGFWSKDLILLEAYHHQPVLFVVALVAAFFTALYMSRLFFLVFTGKARKPAHPHESPAVMTIPLIILAILSVVAGFVNLPGSEKFSEWLTGVAPEEATSYVPMIASTIVALLGISIGAVFYWRPKFSAENVKKTFLPVFTVLNNKYYIDELYQKTIQVPYDLLAAFIDTFDKYVVQGAVSLIQYIVNFVGNITAKTQNGQLQNYALVLVFGLIILAAVVIWMGGGAEVWAISGK